MKNNGLSVVPGSIPAISVLELSSVKRKSLSCSHFKKFFCLKWYFVNKSTSVDCAAACACTVDCVAFSYETNNPGRNCWLRDRLVIEETSNSAVNFKSGIKCNHNIMTEISNLIGKGKVFWNSLLCYYWRYFGKVAYKFDISFFKHIRKRTLFSLLLTSEQNVETG